MAIDNHQQRLGEILLEQGLLEQYQLDYSLLEQKTTRAKLSDILERCGFVSQYDLASANATQWNLKFLDITRIVPENDALRVFRHNLATQHQFLPLRITGNRIDVATSNGELEQLYAFVSRHSGLEPVFHFTEKNKTSWAIQYYYYFLDNPIEELLQRQVAEASNEIQPTLSLDPLITNLFRLAVKKRATDIHIRPTTDCIIISFRVDGLLQPAFSLKTNMRRMISTLKIRSSMDIAEQRLPQDGGFSINVLDTDYDIRASTTVSPDGENMVLRILPRNSNTEGFRELGFLPEDIPYLQQMFRHPHGIILLTGPTGSGKTTTLYAGVRAQDVLRKNIMTVENPIEYKVPLIRQTEVNVKAGYTFASAIRHFLRHDPDIILVGEIRDSETAQTALTAAETGHLVLSTLHTNSVFGTIPRLHSLGVSSFMIADSLIGVVSQRLVRRLCEHCKESYIPGEHERKYLNKPELNQLFRSRGCNQCDHSGYHGRVPIYEILRIHDELGAAIAREDSLDELQRIGSKGGYRSMLDSAYAKLVAGMTSLAEVVRVMGVKG